jgi:protein TonB
MPQRIKVGGNVQAYRIKEKVDPAYPALARQAGISGEVTLEVTIGEDGRVQSVKPLSGHPLLAAAARDAVQQWTYTPTLLNNNPVTVITTVTVPFDLNQ